MNQDTKTDRGENKGNDVRYLSFSLGSEEYAIPLLSVKEVIAIPEITPIPFTPAHFVGIMNLRGQVISVIDLRQKLGIKSKSTAETAIIICDLDPLSLGVVVDAINSVLSPSATELSGKPEIQSTRNTDYITGVYRKNEQLVVFLNIAKTLSLDDQKVVSNAAKGKAA
jgi:purine-binding chemotaxis protein CheW